MLQSLPGLSVDVHKPDVILNVEVRQEGAFLYSRTIPGLGGLPVGASGKGFLLLSGGIDSPRGRLPRAQAGSSRGRAALSLIPVYH